MNAIERYDQLRRQSERQQAEEQRIKGGIDQLIRRLKEELGCEGVLQARRKVEKLGKEAEVLERRSNKIMDRLEATNREG